MKVSVYDTYVPRNNNIIMHFDILVEETTTAEKVYDYGKEYLASKGMIEYQLTTNECNFCHMEQAPEQVEEPIKQQGYYIIEMENCD